MVNNTIICACHYYPCNVFASREADNVAIICYCRVTDDILKEEQLYIIHEGKSLSFKKWRLECL